MSTCIERGFYLTSLLPKYTGLLRPIGIGEKFLMGHPRIEIYVDGSTVWWKNKGNNIEVDPNIYKNEQPK